MYPARRDAGTSGRLVKVGPHSHGLALRPMGRAGECVWHNDVSVAGVHELLWKESLTLYADDVHHHVLNKLNLLPA